MSLESFVTASLPGAFALLAGLELMLPGRRFPSRALWAVKGLLWFAASYLVSTLVVLTVEPWLVPHTLIDATHWGWLPATAAAFLLVEALAYAWHRMVHAVPFFWRWHQTHHAAERIDIWSSWHFHPLDITTYTLSGSIALVVILGVSAEAALSVAFVANTLGMFQHSNLKTPRWLGWFVMRPEQHTLHHERGVHYGNFGNTSIFDLLFGTFSNPEAVDVEVGFYEGASDELGKLLLGSPMDRPAAKGDVPSSSAA